MLIVLIGCGVSYRFVEQKSVFLFHCRLTPVGDPPSPRAAHAATAVGTMVVIQVLHLHSLTKFQLNHCWGGGD